MTNAAEYSLALLLTGALLSYVGGPRLKAACLWLIPAAAVLLIVGISQHGSGWWRVDRLGVLIGIAALVIGGCALHYANRQFHGERRADGIIASSFVVIATVLASDLAANPAALVVSWVATSISVILLLRAGSGNWSRSITAHAAKTFVLTDTCLVAGSLLGWWVVGRHAMTTSFGAHLPRGGAGAVILLAAAAVAAMGRAGLTTRSSWVVGTIATPTSLSALLHAGVVNAGALLLIRIEGLTGSIWGVEIVLIALSLSVLVVLAPRIHARVDLKGQLAVSTVAQMAFMFLTLALGWPVLAITHLIGHGLYKAGRFMAAGGALESRSRQRRQAPQGTHISSAMKVLGCVGIVLIATTFGVTQGGGVLAAMGVFGPGAVVLWLTRTKQPTVRPLATWIVLVLGLSVYGCLLVGCERLLGSSLPTTLWHAPWWLLGVLVAIVSTVTTRWGHRASSPVAVGVPHAPFIDHIPVGEAA